MMFDSSGEVVRWQSRVHRRFPKVVYTIIIIVAHTLHTMIFGNHDNYYLDSQISACGDIPQHHFTCSCEVIIIMHALLIAVKENTITMSRYSY